MILPVAGQLRDPDDVLTLAQFKEFVVDAPTSEDNDLQRAINTAFEDVEDHTGRSYGARQYQLIIDAFPAGNIFIPRPPLISIVSVAYTDSADGAQTLAENTDYTLHGVNATGLNNLGCYGGYMRPVDAGWPSDVKDIPEAITITFSAGYGTPNTVPDQARRGCAIRTGKYWAYKGADYNEESERDYQNTIAPLIIHSFA